MKVPVLLSIFCLVPFVALTQEQQLDPILREALKAPLLEHFKGEFDPAETPNEAQIELILRYHNVESVQIDSDKADERFVHFPFRAERAGGYTAVLDRDGKGVWRCLGFLFGHFPSVTTARNGSYFDLSSAQGIGGGEYVLHICHFQGGKYRRFSSEKKKFVVH